MKTIDKPTVLLLAEALKAYGVRRVVVSPGSRCAPVTAAFNRSGHFNLTPVIDERCAAFVGLGIALATGDPVALVCTSGTAPLNYAPALAEAYYRRVPLIAITADRPASLVDQRDSQTIRQNGSLDAVVRKSIDIADDANPRNLRTASRLMNEVLTEATGRIAGPVQINIQLDAPLTPLTDDSQSSYFRKIDTWRAANTNVPAGLVDSISPSAKVLVVAGGLSPDVELISAVRALSASRKAVVFAEVQSNLHGFLTHFPGETDFAELPEPDIVVSIGGSLVSGRMKAYLRRRKNLRHISLGYDDCLVDTFFRLSDVVECDASAFITGITDRLNPSPDFCVEWYKALNRVQVSDTVSRLQQIVCGFGNADFHFSNGSAARYAQMLTFSSGCRVECNRGVSGIDGATSTAMGYAFVCDRPVVFITGDMSAAYDLGALALGIVPPTFRMVVLDNHGGDIFRAVGTTRTLEECEEFFVCPPHFPLGQLAGAYGFEYYDNDINSFINHTGSPAILRLQVAPGDALNLF